ncbi:MAG TPA: threonine-phosphate decarboxylase CobD [Hyphomicrobium sp.]|jgi:cobalamin biosynthetic protein CobC
MVVKLPEIVAHGGDLDAARRQFPSAPEPWIDLSTGINPHAYPFLPPAAEAWQRLPQQSADHAVRLAAAKCYGAHDVDMLVTAPGSQALIQIVPRLIETSEVAVLGPTYAEHAAAWARCGHEVREIASLTDTGDARALIVVNPNNPTGRIVAADDLRLVSERLAQRGGLLVVDEAFADFATPSVSVIPQLPPATVVLRSFGKAYGLAGLRLGFAVAHVELARRVRLELGPWAVSGPALAIGAQALADKGWLEDTRDKLNEGCQRLDELLAASGFKLEGGTHLFRLASHARAHDVADALGRDGIHVRRFEAHPHWLRFGLPNSSDAWQRLELPMRNSTSRLSP